MKHGAKKKPESEGKQIVAKFSIQPKELEVALNKLIVVEGKEEEFKKGVHDKTTVKDVNGPQIAKELLKPFLPFKLPPGIDLKSIKAQLANLRQELKSAHGLEQDISSEEAEKKRALFKKKKEELNAIEELLGKIEAMNEKFLNLPLVTKKYESMSEDIYDYVTYLKIDESPEDELVALEGKINNHWFPEVRKEILSQYPLNFDDDDMKEAFSRLPKETQERFQLFHVEHIVNLLNTEILAIGDETAQNEKNKAQILFQIETSDLHHDIIEAISSKTDEKKQKVIDPIYEQKIVNMTMETILKEFERGQELGAYNFEYDIEEELKELLNSRQVKNLLIEREKNENNLTNFEEKSKGYKKLIDNMKEYNITKKEHVVFFRRLYKHNKEKMEECNTHKQELNKELYDIIENFIERNSVKVHQVITEEIQVELGVNIPKEFKDVVDQAEKNSQLGWYDWLSSSTFHSRCKRALIGATTAGATGGLAGTVAGLGIFSPITSTLGVVGGVLLGGAAGFASQNIAKGASDTIAELKNIALSYIYGEENKIASEYFKDATECKGINPKYAPTKKMIQIWGEDGAKIIAYKYINFLFELNVKLLYDPPEKAQKEFLELQYKHFYRNYQMLRCDEEEIRKLYSNEKFFAEDRAQKEIEKAKASDAEDCREHVKKDLASMLSILNKEERDNNINHRKAINMLSNTMDNLVATGDKNLILQLSDSPEVKLIQEGKLPEIKNPPLLLLEGAKIEIEEEVEEESDALPVLESMVEKKDTKKLALVVKEEDKTKTLALVSPQEPRALVEINRDKLQQQEMITEAKKNAVVVANAEKQKEKIDKQYQELNYVAIIANRDKNAATNIIKQYQDFVKESTQYKPNMSSTEAAECLKMRDYAEFMFWYDTVFLNKYKNKNNQTRKDAISRRLLGKKGGGIGFDGKSIWHLLCDDTIQGHEILTWMFSRQNDQNFKKFINYFDFEYKDTNNKMNAIVYAASRRNIPILEVYINELFKGYTPGTKKQKRCDETFKQIIQLQDPEDSLHNIICVKLRDEIKSAWKADQERQYQTKSFFKKIRATFSEQFDSTKVLSQILAAMAIYSTQNQEMPQSEKSLHGFLEFLMNNNELVDESVRNLILDLDVRNKVVEQTLTKIESQTELRDFGKKFKNGSHMEKIVTNLCTSDPLPTPEEQKILVAILSRNTQANLNAFTQLISEKPYSSVVRKLLDKKFNDKNLIWLAIEANRPEIAGILYNLSNKHAQMDEAGPNNASAFTFAARKKDKACFKVLCQELSKRTGLTQRAYLTRFSKNQKDDRIPFHYISENATFDVINEFLKTEGLRYSNPDWKRLTGMSGTPPIYHKDKTGNLPLHFLLKNENAIDIIVSLNAAIDSGYIKGVKSIFDLFEIDSLRINNQEKVPESPMSLLMKEENETLHDAFFKSFIKNAEKFADNASYRENLFKCAKMALEFQNDKLFAKLVDCLVKVHNSPKNVGYGYGTNPVTAQIDDLIKACKNIHQDDKLHNDFKRAVRGYLPDLLKLANPSTLKETMKEIYGLEHSQGNQSLMSLMFYAVDKKLTPAEKESYFNYSHEVEGAVDIAARRKPLVHSKPLKETLKKEKVDESPDRKSKKDIDI